MQARDLAPILYGKAASSGYAEATKRWHVVMPKLKATRQLIEAGASVRELEPVERIRSAIQNRARSMISPTWVNKTFDALPPAATCARRSNVSQKAKAGVITEWAAKATPADLRRLGEEGVVANDETLPVEFLECAMQAAKSIGKVSLAGNEGTGFLVGLNLMITNHHVLSDIQTALSASLIMNLEEDRFDPPKKVQQEFRLDPDSFFHTNKDLDYTLVAVRPRSNRDTSLTEFGSLPLDPTQGKILKGHHANIIHHMAGGNKVVSCREGVLVELTNQGNATDFCYYTTDTDKGSSGSPVFNDFWQVVALHHHGVPKVDVNGEVLDRNGRRLSLKAAYDDPSQIAWEANEGTRVSRLVADLEQVNLPARQADLRDQLLQLWLG